MDEDRAEFAVDAASTLGALYADARLERQERNDIMLKNGVLDAASTYVNEGIGIRVITLKGIGFSSTCNLSKESVRKAVKEAFKQAESCRRKAPPRLSEEKRATAVWEVPQKENLSDIDAQQKVDNLLEVDEAISSSGDIPGRMLNLTDKQTKKLVVTSEGTKVTGILPVLICSYFLAVKCGSQVEQSMRRFGRAGGWEGFEQFHVAKDGQHEVEMLQRLMKEGEKSPQGTMDLIVGPDVIGIICHESCGHPMEADRILGREASQAGASFMNEELLGTRVGSDEVTVAEDPTIEHSFGYYGYDDEGVKSRRRLLYKEGMINQFLHNRESAARMGTTSNGAARSSGYNREAIVRMANTFLLPGEYAEEELIEGVNRGIYMKSYTEWNIDDKRYNQKYIGREAYLIEHGEITCMVKRPILEITTPGFWMAVDARGKDLMFRAGNCGKGDPIQEMDVLYGGPTTRLREVFMR
ncbi:MAG: TldD/PmbA family protein [Theionarchaea archaeon]|nr:TldD/PmbA family protein [Theionarchaea archaeon]MBU6999880.1 TldD/PmbA family protein [Theionarchaea archaeon]MBU7020070.1 TldD/PmbA family protein [Theionarchaea archaeon]MBU7034287.1 TldD/PmbA family protein [Theionarchaea archaeon]MBU7039515.1 TldD/PmbA family protein [Theionarchaea archaeon]